MDSLGVFSIYLALSTNVGANGDLIRGVEIIHKGCLKEYFWLARYLQQVIIYTSGPN